MLQYQQPLICGMYLVECFEGFCDVLPPWVINLSPGIQNMLWYCKEKKTLAIIQKKYRHKKIVYNLTKS